MQTIPIAVAKSYRWRRHLAWMFRVKLTGDIPERLIAWGLPLPLNAKRRERLACIRGRGVLLIHVPKNAGTSISVSLYGRPITHDTIRYYGRVAPDFAASAVSVAVMRCPVDRFVSAYRFAQSGGTPHRQLSEPFRATYMAFGSIDDALDHIEARDDPFAVDHIFRAQSWYVTDAAGRVAVRHLVRIDDLARLRRVLPDSSIAPMPRLNASRSATIAVSAAQRARIRHLYRDDVALWEGLRGGAEARSRRVASAG